MIFKVTEMGGSTGTKSDWMYGFVSIAIVTIIIFIAFKLYLRKQQLKKSFKSNIDAQIVANESTVTILSNENLSLKSKNSSCADGKYLCQNGKCDQLKSNDYVESNLLDKWEFPRSKLVLGDELGHGAYGIVVKAEATNISCISGNTIVAVKMLMRNALEIEKASLLSELEMLKNLRKHCNVISLLGCCTNAGKVCCV